MARKVTIGRVEHVVHARTIDHFKGGGFNKAIAVMLQKHVMSMGCFWVFCGLALLSLPATLHLAGINFVTHIGIPRFFLSYGFIFLDAWFCQNFVQLVLLPALGVGQNLQTEAADVRDKAQFDDIETIKADVAVIKAAVASGTTVVNVTVPDGIDSPDVARAIQKTLLDLKRKNGGQGLGLS